jgi:hypothetical protein
MTVYSQEIVNKIIHRVRHGRSTTSIIKELQIGETTFYSWLKDKDKESFQQEYARAKQESADYHADSLIDIADYEPDINRAKIKIDTRKWVASKLKPKVYGDKTTISGDSENPLPIQVVTGIPRAPTD